jgi:hypothetical protein
VGHWKYLPQHGKTNPALSLTCSTILQKKICAADKSPLGRDGTGLKTHAFNEEKGADKETSERQALDVYRMKLSPEAYESQNILFEELLGKKSPEARFVLAIDKLQPLPYILAKKGGKLENKHIQFTLRYSRKAVTYFPPLFPYYKELTSRLLNSVSRHRKLSFSKLMEEFEDGQLTLFSQPS